MGFNVDLSGVNNVYSVYTLIKNEIGIVIEIIKKKTLNISFNQYLIDWTDCYSTIVYMVLS